MEGTLQYSAQKTLHCEPHCARPDPKKPVITSFDLPPTIYEVSKVIRQTSSGKSPGMDGIPAEIFYLTGPVAREALHSLHSSPASGKKRMCPKNSEIPHSSPCLRTGAVRLTAASTGTSLSCPSLGRSWLGSSSTASSPTSRRKTCRKPSVDSVQTAAPPT